MTLVAYDSNSNRINYLDRTIQLSMKGKQYAWTMAHGIPVRLPLDLPSAKPPSASQSPTSPPTAPALSKSTLRSPPFRPRP